MFVDDLMMQGTGASAAIVLTSLSQYIPAPSPVGGSVKESWLEQPQCWFLSPFPQACSLYANGASDPETTVL